MHILDNVRTWMQNKIVDEIILVAILIAFVETTAQNILKSSEQWSMTYLLGLLLYMLVGYMLHWAYGIFPLSKLNTIWSGISIITSLVFGYLFYEEKITHWTILSIIFAVSAIYCSNQ